MRVPKLLLFLALLVVPLAVQAGEKPKAQGQIDAARAAIEAFAKKSDDNKLVTPDIEAARGLLKKGEEAYAAGRTMFGLGDINPEAALEVKHFTDQVDLHLILGQSRIDKAKAAEELKTMSEQVARMKAKVKVFDDRKAELERLRASVSKLETGMKELDGVKAEKARLEEKLATLAAERKVVDAEVQRLKAELVKRDQAASIPTPAAVPAPASSASSASSAPEPVPAVKK